MTQVKVDSTGDILTVDRDDSTGAIRFGTDDRGWLLRDSEATALGHALLDLVDEG